MKGFKRAMQWYRQHYAIEKQQAAEAGASREPEAATQKELSARVKGTKKKPRS